GKPFFAPTFAILLTILTLIDDIMKKSDIEHIQRSRYLDSGQKIKSQVDNIVRSINLKYPELAGNIEIPFNLFGINSPQTDNSIGIALQKYISSLINQRRFA
ncbi:MAG: hypothetical protein ACM3PX_04170, partial [Omnitrophica WOR_2 bacterium]